MQLIRNYWLSYFKVTLWEFELISNYHIKLLLQTEPLKQLALTPLLTTVYLIHLPNPTPSLHLSSNIFAKMCKKWGMFHSFYKRLEKNNKKHLHSVKTGNDILIYINIKQVFFDSLIKSAVYVLIFCQNSMIFEGTPNSLTMFCFIGELRLDES